jgi:hypothetical protein
VWFAIRILRGPPPSPTLDEISWLPPKGPEWAGSAVRFLVSAETNDGHRAVLAEVSLAQKSRFPENVESAVRLEALPLVGRASAADETIRRGD